MKNAQAGKVGFSLNWDVMNNQQEEQEVRAAEAGGKFLSQNPAQALSFLKEEISCLCFYPLPGAGVRLSHPSLGCFSWHLSDRLPICL